MIRPSPRAKHVRIGSTYRPASFEHRASDGAYSSFMRTPNAHCERVQSALIAGRGGRSVRPFVVLLAVALLGAAAYMKGTT